MPTTERATTRSRGEIAKAALDKAQKAVDANDKRVKALRDDLAKAEAKRAALVAERDYRAASPALSGVTSPTGSVNVAAVPAVAASRPTE